MAKKLNEIHRTAAFAWSPGQQMPLIATGTVSGALDDSFSNASELELFKLDLSSKGLTPAGKVSSNARFNTLGWGNATADRPYGVIAGGTENGDLELWDPAAILEDKGAEASLILRNSTHTGPVRALDFNKFQHNLLASAGANNEVYIWDLSNPAKPYSPGAQSSKLDDITSVAWNCQVQHILATSSTTGYMVVWDLRNRKEIMTLASPGVGGIAAGRRGISAVAWHPDVATQIVTASEDESNPVITLWDLRHAHSPEKTLAGHQKGVMGVSWCRQDSDLLLSCGKDCKTLCWNPRTGSLLGEVSQSTNWTFQVDWCPRNPDLLATASFDGKINVFSIQGADSEAAKAAAAEQQAAAAADDPFSAALLAAAPPTPRFSLKHPPKWLRRPVGASFGFSGRLVFFNNKAGQTAAQVAANLPPGAAPAPQKVPRKVILATVVTDPEIVKRSEELESALGQESFTKLINERREQAASTKNDDDIQSWEVLQTLFAENAREQLMQHLGFRKEEILSAVAKLTGGDKENEKPSEPATTAETAEASEKTPEQKNEEAKADTGESEAKPVAGQTTDALSELFQSSSDSSEDFFAQQSAATVPEESPAEASAAGLVAAIQGPLELYPKDSSETDKLITRSIVLGDFESAVELCLASDRLSDALLLAQSAGGELWLRTRKTYFERQAKKTSYLRLLQSIVSNDFSPITQNTSLEDWTSVVVVLCTFAGGDEFATLCAGLGKRLLEAWAKATKEGDLEKAHLYRRHATLCYLVAGKLDKVAMIWILELQEKRKEDKEGYSASLQNLIEKVTVFRKAIEYEDPAIVEDQTGSDTKEPKVYPLAPLYDKYCEYAELMATQGKLDIAQKYLSLTPSGYRNASSDRLSIIRERVYCACARDSSTAHYRTPAFPFEQKPILSEKEKMAATVPDTVNGCERQQAPVEQQQQTAYEPYKPYQPAATAAAVPAQQPANPYAPPTTQMRGYPPQVPGAQYSPFGQTAYNAQPAYGNYGYGTSYASPYDASQTTVPPPPPAAAAPPPATATPPPPPPKGPSTGSVGGSPSVSHQSTSGAWNDPPMIANPNVTKSPAAAPVAPRRVTSPFPNVPAPSAFVPPTPQQAYMQNTTMAPPTAAAAAAPPPPPPTNAVPPTPLARQRMPPPPPPQARPPNTPPPMGGYRFN